MKKLVWGLLGLALSVSAGELSKKVKDTQEENIFWTQRKVSKKLKGIAASISGTEFEIKPKAIKKLIKAKKEHVAVSVQLYGKKEKLLLVKQEPFAYETGSVHYAGIVKEDPESVVSLSLSENKISGFIAAYGKNYQINSEGLLASVTDTEELKAPAILDEPLEVTHQIAESVSTINSDSPIRVFFEVDHQMYLNMGSDITRITNHFNAIWSQVAALYANDGVTIQSSGLKIWTTPDPYSDYTAGATNSIGNTLQKFLWGATRPVGSDLVHLLTTRSGWGGIAYVSALCQPYSAKGVSSIYTTSDYTNAIYQWSVNVVFHELGHNLGSKHTHWCGWTVNGVANQAIDGCWSPEGSCTRPVVPAGFKGTQMSYCHVTGNGIDMRLGFGPLPKAAVHNHINATKACRASYGTGPDVTAPSLFVDGLATGATLSGTATVKILAVDDRAMGRVELQINNQTLTDSEAPYHFAIDTTKFTNGDYAIRARAIDAVGNISAWTGNLLIKIQNGVITDVTKPTITITAPTANASVSGSLAVNASASDNVGVTKVDFRVDGLASVSDASSPFTATFNTTALPNGSRAITATAFDAAGNSQSTSVTVNVQNAAQQAFAISKSVVGQDKSATDSTKRNWIDLTLSGLVGTPTFAAKLATNTSWSAKTPLALGNNTFRVYLNSANTDYDASATCSACTGTKTVQVRFKTLP